MRNKISKKIYQYNLILFFIFITACQPKEVGNVCDVENKDFLTNLLVTANIPGKNLHCGNLVSTFPPFGYKSISFNFFQNIPVNLEPIHYQEASYGIFPPLPSGLSLDPFTGKISGVPTSPLERTNFTVYKSGNGSGIVNLSIRIGSDTAFQVYGQYGSFTCGLAYNDGTCVSASPNAENFSNPVFAIEDSFTQNIYITAFNRILTYSPGSTVAEGVLGQNGYLNCDIGNTDGAGGCGLGYASAIGFNQPKYFGLNANGIYVADSGNTRVLHIPRSSLIADRVYGQVDFSSVAGGTVAQNNLQTPFGIVMDTVSEGFYLSDNGQNRILYFPKDSSLPSRVIGQPDFDSDGAGSTQTNINTPRGLAVDDIGGLYVSDTGNNWVLYFPPGSTSATRVYGQLSFTTTTGLATASNLDAPQSIALDPMGNLYVADHNNNRVVVFPKTEQTAGISAVGVFGHYGSFSCGVDNDDGVCGSGAYPNARTLYRPTGVSITKDGNLMVSDNSNHRVLVF
ncbi:NHL repeat-containing protein [Leptospira sp. 96542]|nr:NHL repeat-containing protein [Leptospira sp. 96542]